MARAMCTYQDQDPDRVLESMDKHRRPVIMWTHWKGEADAALSVVCEWLAYEGLVVVPRDPSDAMAEAGWSVRGTQFEPTPDAQEIYRAMISAAPDALETKP
jgi:hypothetical protein